MRVSVSVCMRASVCVRGRARVRLVIVEGALTPSFPKVD